MQKFLEMSFNERSGTWAAFKANTKCVPGTYENNILIWVIIKYYNERSGNIGYLQKKEYHNPLQELFSVSLQELSDDIFRKNLYTVYICHYICKNTLNPIKDFCFYIES